MTVTSVRLQPDVEESLEITAKRLQRSKNWLINQAIREFLERETLERRRWRETMQALESAGKGRVADGESVHAWLESWGTDNELPPPKP